MQRLRLAARLVNAAPSLMALLRSDACRAWKDNLARGLALLRQEMGPQLAEVDGLPHFERFVVPVPEGLETAAVFVPAETGGTPPAFGALAASSSLCLPTFSCDQCDAVFGKLGVLRSHKMRAHQRRREARR